MSLFYKDIRECIKSILMKPSFHIKASDPFDDPGLYVRVLREGKALMFDLGLSPFLTNREILKITDIFVSHTHIDHFMGFDQVLRICLKRESPLRVYGPKGIIECIRGKLKGYTWNLADEYPLIIEAYEIKNSVMKHTVFRAEEKFKLNRINNISHNGTIMRDSFYSVSACILDHQIPCLAFSLSEDYHINIDRDKLNKLNLPVGPWLNEFKQAIREKRTDAVFHVDGKMIEFNTIKEIAKITRGQKISYVVDVLYSEKNIDKIIDFVRNSDILFIEAYFLDSDRERAEERYHLTARQAGIIAREAGVRRLEPIHFSPRYMDDPESLRREAMSEMNKREFRAS